MLFCFASCPMALCNIIIHAKLYTPHVMFRSLLWITHGEYDDHFCRPPFAEFIHLSSSPDPYNKTSISSGIGGARWMTWIPLFHVLISFQRRNIQFVPFAGCFPVCVILLFFSCCCCSSCRYKSRLVTMQVLGISQAVHRDMDGWLNGLMDLDRKEGREVVSSKWWTSAQNVLPPPLLRGCDCARNECHRDDVEVIWYS